MAARDSVDLNGAEASAPNGFYSGILPQTQPTVPGAAVRVAQATASAPPATIVVELEDGNIARLPAGADISNVSPNGADLEFVQPDGTVIIIPGGAIANLVLFIGDIQIPTEAVAQIFAANDIQTAAGPEGGNTRPDGASGNFFDPGEQNVGDWFQKNSLLGNTDLPVSALENEDPPASGNAPPVIVSSVGGNVSDEGLKERGGLPDDLGKPSDSTNETSISGRVVVTDDGGPLTFSFGIPAAGYTSGGQSINWTVSGGTLIGSVAGDPPSAVFTATIDSSGNWTVTLSGPFDHPDKTGEDVLPLLLPVTVTDSGGLSASTTLQINIEDDSPEWIRSFGDEGLSSLSVEWPIASVQEGDKPDRFSGDLNISWGADNGDLDDGKGGQDGARQYSTNSADLTGRALFFSSDTVESSSQKLTSQGQEVLTRLDESGTKLIGYVPAGEGDSEVSSEPVERIIFEVTLSDDGSGSYTFTLLGALDHPDMGEDTFDLTFYFTARDADGDTTTGSFSVFLRDDVPDAIDDPSPAQSVYENTSRTNLVLAFDRSGSMGDDADGHGGLNHSRLALAKAAAIDLLNASNVGLVLIVTFSDDATVQNWMTKAQAIAFISGNTFPGPNGGTDYDDVTKAIINSYGTPTGPGAVYFFTDGKPSSEGNSINDSEQLAWDNFLAQKGIQSYAVAVGTGLGNIANDPDLLDLANPDGHIISLQVGNAGDDALLATAPAGASTPVTGNVLANDVFGADGAGANNGLKSVTIAGVEYTFTGSQITFGVNQVIPGSILTVPTSLGGTFTFYFANGSGHNAGDYAYGPPVNVDTNQTEVFVYKIVDGDGDTDTASLSIQVLAKPTLSIGDVTVNEADGTATFTVTLTGKLAADLNFFATTTDGTAVDGTPENGAGTDDYTASNRTLTFPAAGGTTQTQTFTVPIGNDTVFEGNEQFFVRLTGVSPALVDLPRSDLQAVGTIVDNDVAPTLTISSPSATEGGGNSDDLKFVLGLSHASQSPITLVLKTSDGTAVANGDYDATTFTVTFAPGETQKTVTLDTNNDSLDEADETVILKVDSVSQGAIANPTAFGTGTIIDNDPTPTFSINDRMVNEADGTITFTVSLSAPSGQATSVNYMVNPGTAQTGDYTGTTSGTLNFAAGDTSKTITLTIVNDSLTEATETFSVVLSNPVNATFRMGQALARSSTMIRWRQQSMRPRQTTISRSLVVETSTF